MTSRVPIAISIALTLVLAGPASAAAASKCGAKQFTAAGQAALAFTKCRAKAVRAGELVDPGCLAAAGTKLGQKLAKAARKPDCGPPLDEEALRAAIDSFLAALDGLISVAPLTTKCCQLVEPGFACADTSIAADCFGVPGAPGVEGSFCDGSGLCQPLRTSVGNCCELDGICFEGDLSSESTSCPGTLFTGAVCRPDGTCGSP